MPRTPRSQPRPSPQRAGFAVATVAAAWALLWPLAPAAQVKGTPEDAQQQIENVHQAIADTRRKEQDLEHRAKQQAEQVRTLRRSLMDSASQIQDLEDRMQALEVTLSQLTVEEADVQRTLRRHGQVYARGAGAILRLAQHSPESIIALPQPPVDTVRTAILLRAALPAVESLSETLRGHLDTLVAKRRAVTRAQLQLAAVNAELAGKRHKLDAELELRRLALSVTQAEIVRTRDHMADLARKAHDLTELLAAIEADRVAREAAAAAARRAMQAAAAEARQRAEAQAERQQAAARVAAEAKRKAEAEAAVESIREQAAETAKHRAQLVARASEFVGVDGEGRALPALPQAAPAEAAAEPRSETQVASLSPAAGIPGPGLEGSGLIDRPAAVRAFPDEPGGLTLPVRGAVISRFSAEGGTEQGTRGIRIASRPGALVVAPYDGRVVFAGPFRGHGQILIIDHGGGYHSLLAGLGRIETVVGQWLLAGEPVATMGRPENAKPTLYVELRRNGEPFDPLPWIASGKHRNSG